jgi:cleavage and polyadenylation specificity factor subunit 4
MYDLSKMPLCRHGERCKVHDCPFRHISEANRLECVFYSQGFCIHGPFCRYKHVRRERIDLPAVADFTLGLSQMQAAGKDGAVTRRPAPKPNEFFKISLCKHFTQGECPFGDGCHFAHGEHGTYIQYYYFSRRPVVGVYGYLSLVRLLLLLSLTSVSLNSLFHAELRNFPRPPKNEPGGEETEISDNIFSNQDTQTVDYFQGGASGGGKPSPILEPEEAHFFLIRSATQTDLAISTFQAEWYVQRKHANQLNEAFQNSKGKSKGKGGNHQQVMLFFTASDSRHIQGAALMTSIAEFQSGGVVENENSAEAFAYRLGVEWYRTTEFPIATALEAAPDLLLPTAQTQFCQDMSPATGEKLMKALWNSPLVTLYESWSADDEEDPPAPEALLTDFRCPPIDEIPWPVLPGPGFIFGCSSDTMDECLGRGLLGLPAHMKAAAQWIVPGTSVFLFNVTDRLLFGIFEALTPAGMNLEPTAFSKNPNAKESPFPVQIRVRVGLECPPLEDTDPILNDILRSRGSGRIGPLTFAQNEAIASLLANECGALPYMMDYQQATWEGAPVNPPPIALPPRKIAKKT